MEYWHTRIWFPCMSLISTSYFSARRRFRSSNISSVESSVLPQSPNMSIIQAISLGLAQYIISPAQTRTAARERDADVSTSRSTGFSGYRSIMPARIWLDNAYFEWECLIGGNIKWHSNVCASDITCRWNVQATSFKQYPYSWISKHSRVILSAIVPYRH